MSTVSTSGSTTEADNVVTPTCSTCSSSSTTLPSVETILSTLDLKTSIIHTPATPIETPLDDLNAVLPTKEPLKKRSIPIPLPSSATTTTSNIVDDRLSTSPTSVSFVEDVQSGSVTPNRAASSSSTSTASTRPQSRQTSSLFSIPPSLTKPGIEMLKVSAKSARRVKSRKVWLELSLDGPEDGELSLELGFGLGGWKDVRICWEKNGLGLGLKKEASTSLSRIRDIRFGTQGSPYRTSLQISSDVENRWMTIIYIIPPSNSTSSFLLNNQSNANYKMVHFIAPSVNVLELWKITLEKLREGRVAKGFAIDERTLDGAGDTANHQQGDEDKVVCEAEVFTLCAKLGMGMAKAEISEAFKKAAAPNDHLNFEAFQKFVKLLKRREEVDEIFQSVADQGKDTISAERWAKFLTETQHHTASPDTITKSFIKFADPETKLITIDGFSSYLMSSDNTAIKDESNQDMTRPLSEYYISSSHNTYLVGNQIQGQSTVEGYIRALQQGCRCVELDVYDGDDDEPVVTHGLTLTSKIAFRDILHAIAKYAFLASPYPVILSMEVHCDIPQQNKMVELMCDILGDKLIRSRIEGLGDGPTVVKLPSPTDLKGKFLLKAKNKFVSSTNTIGLPLTAPPSSDDTTSSASESNGSDSDFGKVLRAVKRRVISSRGPSPGSTSPPPLASPTALGPASSFSSVSYTSTASFAQSPPTRMPGLKPTSSTDTISQLSSRKPKEQVMSTALLALLIYTVGVKLRGFNKKETYEATHVISVGENSLTKMIKDEGARQDFISHNRGHLTRAYPKGSRVDSSNYEPHNMWALGVQLVALNWQTFDVGMELNAAMFARAGRSGYVLKPELLRKKGAEKDKTALVRSQRYCLEVEIISAQQLPRPREPDTSDKNEPSQVDPFIEVSLFQPNISPPSKKRTRVVQGNAFNPVFRSTLSFDFTAHPSQGMLDLVFLRLEVLNARGNLKAAMDEGKGDFLGAYAISIGVLLPGYRHFPLYDSIGDQHLFSTVFIKSKLVLLDAV